METIEDYLFGIMETVEYYTGIGEYTDEECIYIQILAEIIYND